MRVAIKFSPMKGVPFVENGEIVGQDSGLALVRRLLKLWPDPIVIGKIPSDGNGFEVMPLHSLNVNETVIVSMDLIGSLQLYVDLKKSERWHHPKIVNFAWFNVSEYSDPVHLAMLGLSVVRFPTFCNSARTLAEFRENARLTISPAASLRASMDFCPLGVTAMVGKRVEHEVPVVRYPAMLLFGRKRPEMFLEIMDSVAAVEQMTVVARIGHDSPMVKDWQARSWMDIGPLGSREEYRKELETTDVFLATADDESYGLAYVEQLQAGVIGVFPDRPWVRSLVPHGYPFVYGSQSEAVAMMLVILRDLPAARAAVADVPDWIRLQHDEARFGPAFVHAVRRWYMERE